MQGDNVTVITKHQLQIQRINTQPPKVTNFSLSAKVHLVKGLVLSSLTLSIAYAIHAAYQSWIENCSPSSSPIGCARAVGVLSGVVSGTLSGTVIGGLSFLLSYNARPDRRG